MILRIRRSIEQGKRSTAFWMVLFLALVGAAVNLSSAKGWLSTSESWAQEKLAAPLSQGNNYLREGTEVVDLVGRFRIVGDRIAFIETAGGNRTFKCLENLALQRVYQAIRDEDREKNWILQGKITEYLNENYLLIERVVRAAPTKSRE